MIHWFWVVLSVASFGYALWVFIGDPGKAAIWLGMGFVFFGAWMKSMGA